VISVLNNLFCIFLRIFPRRAESVSYESPAESVCTAIYTYLDGPAEERRQPIRRVESLNNIMRTPKLSLAITTTALLKYISRKTYIIIIVITCIRTPS